MDHCKSVASFQLAFIGSAGVQIQTSCLDECLGLILFTPRRCFCLVRELELFLYAFYTFPQLVGLEFSHLVIATSVLGLFVV